VIIAPTNAGFPGARPFMAAVKKLDSGSNLVVWISITGKPDFGASRPLPGVPAKVG
jgi:hypothetical protein